MFDINWIQVLITVVSVLIILNLMQFIKAFIRKKTIQMQVKKSEAKIEELKKELENRKKDLEESIRRKIEEMKK